MMRPGKSAFTPLLSIAALLLVSACASLPEGQDDYTVIDRTGDVVPVDEGETQDCAAEAYQHLVGQMIGEVHTESLPQPLRVYSTDMSVTMDCRPNRMNIVTSPQGRVLEVKCG